MGAVVEHVVSWFEASNILYWVIAAPAIIALVFFAFFTAIRGLRQKTDAAGELGRVHNPFPFIIAMGLVLVAFRWPVILYPYELNVDESQMIAQASKFLNDDPIPWRSVDSGSAGPLDSYAILLSTLLGLDLDYAGARFIGLLCIVGTLSFTFLTFRVLFDDFIARNAVVPMLVFFCFTRFEDYLHYSSEHLPIMLLSSAIYLLLRYFSSDTGAGGLLLLSGLVLGAIPLTKLQAAPLSVLICLCGFFAIFIKRREKKSGPAAGQLVAFCCGILLIPAAILIMTLWGKAFGDFWKSYIVCALTYSSAWKFTPFSFVVGAFLNEPDFYHFLIGNSIFLIASAVFAVKVSKNRRRSLLSLSSIYLLASSYIVFAPLKPYYHYLLFLIPSFTLLSGIFLGNIVLSLEGHHRFKLSISCLILFLGITCILQVPKEGIYYNDNIFVKRAGDYFRPNPDPVRLHILSLANPGEKMAIWGWTPKYFVSTGLVPATRDAATPYQITPNPLREYYRQRFLSDLKVARPPVFVDAVSSISFWYHDRNEFGHETYDELAQFIRRSYTLVDVIGTSPDDAIRIYALNERLLGAQAGR